MTVDTLVDVGAIVQAFGLTLLVFAAGMRLVVFLADRTATWRDRPWRRVSLVALLAAVIAATNVVGALKIGPLVPTLVELLAAKPIVGMFVGGLAGGALFLLRRWRKDVYGALEVVFALATCAFIADQPLTGDLVAPVIGFGSAVYVLVRGLTNISEGTARPRPVT